jgi:hypothetical protein
MIANIIFIIASLIIILIGALSIRDFWLNNKKELRKFHNSVGDRIGCIFTTKFHDEHIIASILKENPYAKDLQVKINLLTEDRDQWRHLSRSHTSAINAAYKEGYKKGFNDCDNKRLKKDTKK